MQNLNFVTQLEVWAVRAQLRLFLTNELFYFSQVWMG